MEDLAVLAHEMLRILSKEMGRTAPSVTANALKKLSSYGWPGNVRELRNVLERAMLTLPGNEIRSEDLTLESAGAVFPNDDGLPTDEWQIQPLDDLVNKYVAAAVRASGGNMRKAARQLKISPSTLYARLKAKEV
jgi:DNA-binding NtrC family response regulator